MHRISIEKAQIILETLATYGNNGRGIIALSLETGISKSTIRVFLKSNKDFARSMHGVSKFKINKFGDQRGNVEDMIGNMKRRRRTEYALNVTSIILFVLFILMTRS